MGEQRGIQRYKVTHCEERDVQNSDMKRHTQNNGPDQKHVLPHRKNNETLVFRKRVHGIKHLDSDENRQAHGRCSSGHDICEHFTPDFRETRAALMEVALQEDIQLAAGKISYCAGNIPVDTKRSVDLQSNT